MEHKRPISVRKRQRPLSLIETVVAALFLSALAAAVFVPYVLRGGFYSDDWSNAALFERLSFGDGVADTAETLGARPLLAVLLPVPHVLFGVSPGAHIGLGIALGVLTCLAFYAVLRVVDVPLPAAGAMAGLALVFPWSNAIRLWATASMNTVAVLLALLGMLFALHSLDKSGRRAVVVHAVAIALFLLSVLTYEAAAGVMLLFGALYLGRTTRPQALRLWAADVVAIVIALVYTAVTINKNVGGIGDRFADVPRFIEQGIALLSYSFVPPGTTERWIRTTAVAIVAAVVVVALHRFRSTRDPVLGYWLRVAGVAVVVIAASYGILLGTYLQPINPGIGNRSNLVAEYGYAVLVVALVMVAVNAFGLRGRTASVVAIVGVAMLGTGYVAGTIGDERDWERAARLQEPVLAAVERARPSLPRGATVLTVGHPGFTAPGVPVFYATWDLNGAIHLSERLAGINGLPVHDQVRVDCGDRAMYLTYPSGDAVVRVPYRATYALDVSSGSLTRIEVRADCRQLT